MVDTKIYIESKSKILYGRDVLIGMGVQSRARLEWISEKCGGPDGLDPTRPQLAPGARYCKQSTENAGSLATGLHTCPRYRNLHKCKIF
jgi:hypothetical protein